MSTRVTFAFHPFKVVEISTSYALGSMQCFGSTYLGNVEWEAGKTISTPKCFAASLSIFTSPSWNTTKVNFWLSSFQSEEINTSCNLGMDLMYLSHSQPYSHPTPKLLASCQFNAVQYICSQYLESQIIYYDCIKKCEVRWWHIKESMPACYCIDLSITNIPKWNPYCLKH